MECYTNIMHDWFRRKCEPRQIVNPTYFISNIRFYISMLWNEVQLNITALKKQTLWRHMKDKNNAIDPGFFLLHAIIYYVYLQCICNVYGYMAI